MARATWVALASVLKGAKVRMFPNLSLRARMRTNSKSTGMARQSRSRDCNPYPARPPKIRTRSKCDLPRWESLDLPATLLGPDRLRKNVSSRQAFLCFPPNSEASGSMSLVTRPAVLMPAALQRLIHGRETGHADVSDKSLATHPRKSPPAIQTSSEVIPNLAKGCPKVAGKFRGESRLGQLRSTVDQLWSTSERNAGKIGRRWSKFGHFGPQLAKDDEHRPMLLEFSEVWAECCQYFGQ